MSNTFPHNDEREQLSAYLDGELAPEDARAVEARLSVDPNACRELESLRRAKSLLDALPTQEASRDFARRTLERLPRRRPGWERISLRSWRGWSVAAAILVALLAGFVSVRSISWQAQDRAGLPRIHDGIASDNGRGLDGVDDIDFLHKLANPNDTDLFGEEVAGS